MKLLYLGPWEMKLHGVGGPGILENESLETICNPSLREGDLRRRMKQLHFEEWLIDVGFCEHVEALPG